MGSKQILGCCPFTCSRNWVLCRCGCVRQATCVDALAKSTHAGGEAGLDALPTQTANVYTLKLDTLSQPVACRICEEKRNALVRPSCREAGCVAGPNKNQELKPRQVHAHDVFTKILCRTC
eukprot:359706-Chlamydomonas_euryale.AAC.5